MRTVSIFGCGWVGRALAHALQPNFKVYCSVRSRSSYEKLQPHTRHLLAYPDLYHEAFYQANTFVIAIPPKHHYLETLDTVLPYIPSRTQIILLSSVSVYTQTHGVIYEETITKPTRMLQAEEAVRTRRADSIILRLGGLMGYDRIAGKYTVGKILEHDKLVNYIHRDDAVRIITLCIEKEIRGETLNVVAPLHPRQSHIFAQNANRFGWEKTYYKSNNVRQKLISSQKLIEKLDNTFLKPDPLRFW